MRYDQDAVGKPKALADETASVRVHIRGVEARASVVRHLRAISDKIEHGYSEASAGSVGLVHAFGEIDAPVWAESEPPIDDPSERAIAVAKMLRALGFYTKATSKDGQHLVMIAAPTPSSEFPLSIACMGQRPVFYDVEANGRAAKSARAIADEIRLEEAKCAKAWAGDD